MQVLKGIQRFPFSKKKKKIRGFLWKYPEVVLAIHYFQCYCLANKDLEFYKKSNLEQKTIAYATITILFFVLFFTILNPHKSVSKQTHLRHFNVN